jgi:hypothetical protein
MGGGGYRGDVASTNIFLPQYYIAAQKNKWQQICAPMLKITNF